jgi:hypothetical protein
VPEREVLGKGQRLRYLASSFRRASHLAHHPADRVRQREIPMKSPLSAVKDTFGDKAKLVAELEKFTKDDDLWVSRVNASKGLAHVSNAKLLRLHKTFSAVKEKFGSRAKLIDAIAEVEKRAKDDGYKTRLGAYPVPRLWDMYQSATKRAGKAAKPKRAAGAKVEKKPKVAAKAPKKVAAKKKTASSSKKKSSKKG